MSRFDLWRGHGGRGFRFVDHHLAQLFRVSGTPVLVHKYLGPRAREGGGTDFPSWDDFVERDDLTLPDVGVDDDTDKTVRIQDLFFLENRDREYSRDLYDVRGVYTPEDVNFELRQFGLFLNTDFVVMDFHLRSLVDAIGRPIIPGDVLELPHLRQKGFSPDNPFAINRYYVVEDAARGGEGWDMHWLPHIWRCRCGPVRDQQEFAQILEREWRDADGHALPKKLADVASLHTSEDSLARTLADEADRQIPFIWFQHAHLYVYEEWLERSPENGARPVWKIVCMYGDGEPPNAATPVAFGSSFPASPSEGDWFLRIDFSPPALYRRKGAKWEFIEYDRRSPWHAADRRLVDLVREDGTVVHEGTGEEIPKRQAISKVLRPRRRRLKGVVPTDGN